VGVGGAACASVVDESCDILVLRVGCIAVVPWKGSIVGLAFSE
jgi:hypothetical protein